MIEDLKKLHYLVKEIKKNSILSDSLSAEVMFEIAIHNLNDIEINYKILFNNLNEYKHNIIRLKIKKFESIGIIKHELGADGRMRFITITNKGWDLLNEYLVIYKENPI